jgi:hypothetical protein
VLRIYNFSEIIPLHPSLEDPKTAPEGKRNSARERVAIMETDNEGLC